MLSEEKLFEKMYLIRETEKMIEKYFEQGLMRGTTHGYIGQEAIAVGVLTNINIEVDYVTSGHRCHGHYLALTDDVVGLVGEIMGKEIGIIQGKGASQHIKYKNFYTNGITGGMIPISVGIGLSKKLKNEEGVVISFLGDGAMNEGYVFEAFNLAQIYKTPNIFILENNNYAMSTTTLNYTAGTFEKRIKSLGMKYVKYKVLDVKETREVFLKIYKNVKEKKIPYFIEFETYRFCGHSKSDKREYIDKKLEKYWLENDPLKRLEKELFTDKVVKIKEKVLKKIKYSFEKALKSKEPNPKEVLKNDINE